MVVSLVERAFERSGSIVVVIAMLVIVGSGYGSHGLKGRIWGLDPQVRSVNRYRYPMVVAVVLGRSSERR
jgi:hypothetical protein